nr:lef5 [Calliteara abietis nucleopolyhedrovirus]
MAEHKIAQMLDSVHDQKVVARKRPLQANNGPRNAKGTIGFSSFVSSSSVNVADGEGETVADPGRFDAADAFARLASATVDEDDGIGVGGGGVIKRSKSGGGSGGNGNVVTIATSGGVDAITSGSVHENSIATNSGVDNTKTVGKNRVGGGSGGSGGLHCYDLFLIFKQFRTNNQYKEVIDFLTSRFPNNVKNKTFNFVNTSHLFHSLYAYIPAITNVEKERKQIRLSVECIQKLFSCTINDFKLYIELFEMIKTEHLALECPCQLLLRRREEIKLYVASIHDKKFDNKPPKLKKETIDNIMYKYSLNWKNLLLKQKTTNINSNNNNSSSNSSANCLGNFNATNKNVYKKKRKLKKRIILTDDYLYLNNFNNKNNNCNHDNDDGEDDAAAAAAANDNNQPRKLKNLNGLSLTECKHDWIVVEKQLRASDEIVSFIRYCRRCAQTTL